MVSDCPDLFICPNTNIEENEKDSGNYFTLA